MEEEVAVGIWRGPRSSDGAGRGVASFLLAELTPRA
jgi:hypothetical protein